MGVGSVAAQKGTSDVLGETSDKQQTSLKADIMGTVETEPLLRLHTPTETFFMEKTGDILSPVKLIPEPPSLRREIRGKTLGAWGLDRRRAARELLGMWQEASSNINSDGFAVYVDAVISKLEEYMPRFRNIPNEDVSSGVLQLVRDAISGPNFERVQKERLEGPITDVLTLLRQKTIMMATYKAAHDTLYDLGLLKKA
ncbi:MAG TPA: hypothetical protein VMW72_21485 [Sedimentisphaerales bacterium]|nr:hypothetical protein [Sedimentisphaerales bacterium]